MINKLTNFHVFLSYFLNAYLINANIFSILLAVSLSLKHTRMHTCICILYMQLRFPLFCIQMERNNEGSKQYFAG